MKEELNNNERKIQKRIVDLQGYVVDYKLKPKERLSVKNREKVVRQICDCYMQTGASFEQICALHNITARQFYELCARNPELDQIKQDAQIQRKKKQYLKLRKQIDKFAFDALKGYKYEETRTVVVKGKDGNPEVKEKHIMEKFAQPDIKTVERVLDRLERIDIKNINRQPNYNFLDQRTLNNVQIKIFFDDYKYKIVTKGRRVGLTYGMALYSLQKMTDYLVDPKKYRPVSILWGDVGHKQIRGYVEQIFSPLIIRHNLSKIYNHRVHDSVITIGEQSITFRQAENPETWEGFDYDFILLNEAGIILKSKPYLWENAVKPMLLSKPNAKVIMAGVPKQSSGPFRETWDWANQGDDRNYKQYSFSSYENNLINSSEIDDIVRTMDELTIRQEIYGEFVDFVNRPFAYAFDESKHVKDIEINKEYPVFLQFDFNVDPITCIAVQELGDGSINVVKEFRLQDSDIYRLCSEIRKYFNPNQIFAITGDATGNSRQALTVNNSNYYNAIRNELEVPKSIIKTPSVNPLIEEQRVLLNSILTRHPKFYISSSCKYLIEDLKKVEVNDDGDIDKKKDSRRSHLLDCLRYYFNQFHKNFVRNF